MNAFDETVPQDIGSLAERCVAHVRHRLAFELDYTYETLGVLDHFVRLVVADEGGGTVPPPGHQRRAHLVHLLAPTFGAYFGEVVRRAYPCRWRMDGEDPAEWALEFDEIFLRFNPLGAAAEALVEKPVETWGGSLATSPEETPLLAERLSLAPPLPENEFYALTSRFDVLQIAEDWLRCRQAGACGEPVFFGPEDYDLVFLPGPS
ncbi:MAG: hypothetical protein PHU25_02930 [Deltaproteobacteria bacterium]|nr:hypothetical protein [Deltaproteobacteria bacterium]